jgi:hypothetical protein
MPDRPAWAQGPEWEKWDRYGDGMILRTELSSIEIWKSPVGVYYRASIESPHFENSGSIMCNSVNALRIYAEGLLRLEAELEASE